jgi:hypothetical protein
VYQVGIDRESEAADVGNKIGLRVVVALRACGREVDDDSKKKHCGDGFRTHGLSSFWRLEAPEVSGS